MKFQQEQVKDVLDELKPLLHDHYKEIAKYQDIPLDPDFNKYNDPCVRFYTVRDEGRLVGYAAYFTGPHVHYKSSMQAIQDVLYLSPEQRGKTVGFRFILWCDEQLKNDGVQVVYQHVKKDHDFSSLLERIGYELVDYVYGRRL